jgi:hypothetical protein
VQERVDFCVECLGLRWHKSQIKRGFWAKFDTQHKDEKGKRTSAQTIERYLSRAREAMRQRFLERAENHADTAVAFLEGVIRSPKAKYIERLRAQEQLTELLGLAAAQKLVVHHDNALAKEDIDRRIDAVFGIVRRATAETNGNGSNGHSNGNGHHEANGHVDHEAQEATA